jgi:hypothetical protein
MSLLFVHYEHPSMAASNTPHMIYARSLNHKEPKASHLLPAGFRMPGRPCEDEHLHADLLDFGPGGPPWSILGHYADLKLSYFSEPNRTNTPEPWLDWYFTWAIEQRFRAEAIQVPEWILPDSEEEDGSLGTEPEGEMPYWGQEVSPPESTWSNPNTIWDPPAEHPEANNDTCCSAACSSSSSHAIGCLYHAMDNEIVHAFKRHQFWQLKAGHNM